MPVYKHCTTESGVDRQRQFESALLELMAQKSYDQIAVKDICEKVNLSRKSFYRYFSSKEACLCALVDHAILDMTDVPTLGEQPLPMLERYFAYWKQHRQLLDVLCRNGQENLLFQRGMVCAAQEFGIRDYLSGDGDSYAQTIFFLSGLNGILLSWHLDGYQKSPAQLAATLNGLFHKFAHSSVF